MLFCDAYPIKKMLPLDRIATANPCLGEFHGCMLFGDAMARLGSAELQPGARARLHAAAAAARKEGSS
jgi:hypothetical protein